MISWKVTKALGTCGLAWVASLMLPGAARAQDCFRCQHTHCPPGLKHCLEGAPHIHYRHGCPRPICNPCVNPNWGYFEPCWNPWPWAPDFSHCRAVPPAATVVLNPGLQTGIAMPQGAPTAQPDVTLPPPRPVRPGL